MTGKSDHPARWRTEWIGLKQSTDRMVRGVHAAQFSKTAAPLRRDSPPFTHGPAGACPRGTEEYSAAERRRLPRRRRRQRRRAEAPLARPAGPGRRARPGARSRGSAASGSPSSLTPPCSSRRRASLRADPEGVGHQHAAGGRARRPSPAYGPRSTSSISSGACVLDEEAVEVLLGRGAPRPSSWKRSTIRRPSARFASFGGPSRQLLAEQQPVVLGHRLVGDPHQPPEHLLRRVGHADVVAERLAHLLDAVGADQDRHGQDRLRRLAVGGLDVAAEEQVELLVGPPELDVGLDRDRVVALQQRVEQLQRGDRRVRRQPLLEVVALEQARHRRLRQQARAAPRGSIRSHSLLRRTSVRSRSRTLNACSW